MESTIAAISTAYGEGGIGIIRISGEKSLEILERIFRTQFKKENRRMVYGHIVDPWTDETVDEVLAVYMKGPNTYTREDVVEINCHGSVVSLRKTLDLTLKCGAELAEPGEFTKRAFLNGRLDLSQAEAVIDMIKAKSDRSFDVAIKQLEGAIGKKISSLRKDLLDVLVDISVNIDYPDEDIEEIVYDSMIEKLKKTDDEICRLIETSDTGKMIREGIRIAIIGKPNVGKSSLMNGLLNENRAIVTAIPGTTRDIIEENLVIRDIPVILTDTAGIRDTEDLIEKIGIEKSKESFNNADLVIFMLDGSRELDDEDRSIASHIGERRTLILLNKTDLEQQISEKEIREMVPEGKIIETSMENGEGIDRIKDEIENLVYSGKVKQNDSLIITNIRHDNLLRNASAALRDAISTAESGGCLDFVEVDVKRGFELLGEITGESVNDEIITEVFSRFCLGK